MPGPFAVDSALHGAYSFGRGPYQYGASLFCFGFVAFGVVGVYKSTDEGETWTQVGSTKSVTSSNQTFASCLSNDGEYVYLLYVGPTPEYVVVSRLNLSLEDFDSDSPDGPHLADGASNAPVLNIAQASDGVLVVMLKTFRIGGQSTASIATLNSGISSWSSTTEPSGQTGTKLFLGCGLVAMASGRVHGFVDEEYSGDHRLLHVLAYGAGGSIGTDFDEVAEIADGFPNVSAAAFGTKIGVAFNSFDVGIGNPQAVSVAIAEDADVPTWSVSVVDDSTVGTEVNSQLEMIGGSNFRLIYWPSGGDLLAAIYDGVGWGSPEVLTTPADFAVFMDGGEIDNGFGFLYADTDFISDPTSLYFHIAGGATITGSVGIPSEEAFGKTHGVFGGGEPETCGAPVPIPPAVPCQQIPVTPAYPGDQDSCPTSGYSF